MKRLALLLSAAALLLPGLTPIAAAAETLRIGGTGAATAALELFGPEFTKATGITLEVIPGLGTGGANAATADGVLGLAVAGRDLKEKELALGLKVAATFQTPFGLVTSRPGEEEMSSAEIAAFFAAAQPTWPDGKPMRIILRPVEESDNTVLGNLFPGLAEAIEQARLRPDLSVAATDQDNALAAEATEGSLVGATLTQILTEKRNLRFVAIDGVAPSLSAYEDGSYPYGKTLFVVVPANPSPEAEAFLSYIQTPEAKAIQREMGILAGEI